MVYFPAPGACPNKELLRVIGQFLHGIAVKCFLKLELVIFGSDVGSLKNNLYQNVLLLDTVLTI